MRKTHGETSIDGAGSGQPVLKKRYPAALSALTVSLTKPQFVTSIALKSAEPG
jgi:hypothetical protein